MDSRMRRFTMTPDYCSLGLDLHLSPLYWFLFPSFLRADKSVVGNTDTESSPPNEVPLENIEDNQQFETDLVKRVARVIESLPSLEPGP